MASVAATELTKARKEAPENRVRFLERLADKYAEDNNTTRETAKRELMKHEEIREIFREISNWLKPRWEGQLQKVWIPETIGVPRREYVLKEVIDEPKRLIWKVLR